MQYVMGLLKFLFGPAPAPKVDTYLVTLKASKSFGGSSSKTIELKLTAAEARDMNAVANKAAAARSLGAVYWPGAPVVTITNGPRRTS